MRKSVVECGCLKGQLYVAKAVGAGDASVVVSLLRVMVTLLLLMLAPCIVQTLRLTILVHLM